MTNSIERISDAPRRRLHIGGVTPAPGWEILNAVPGPHVHHLGNANDLSRFEDSTFDDIYASHVVEHFDYKDELLSTLKEWHRALRPAGELHVSVPDLDVLARLFIADQLSQEERFFVMRMMFGGHVDAHDYHQVGLNHALLTAYLHLAGFVEITRVRALGLFEDTSTLTFKGVLISLNMTARRPR